MIIIRSINQMREFVANVKMKGLNIGFVPTMGALHAGHASLIRACRKDNDIAVVSIFVNPTQFGPNEDFKKYPRTLRSDQLLCRKGRVDVVFYPKAEDMYSPSFKTSVLVAELSQRLCGESRPNHFQGVTTVVAKLLNIVSPHVAYFGQKDAQQAIIIKKMVEDLNMPVKIKVMATVRQNSGLALSSRNRYLSDNEKKDALVLHQSLRLAKHWVSSGVSDARLIIRQMRSLIQSRPTAKIDYIAIVDLDSLDNVRHISHKVLLALAVWIGRTRLIDNVILSPSGQ